MRRLWAVGLVLWWVPVAAQSPGVAGDWLGTLDAGAVRLRLVLHVTGVPAALAATLDSPDQNARGLPVASVTLNGAALRLELPAIGARFAGTVSTDGQRIDGEFTQGGATVRLAFTRVSDPAALERPRPQVPSGPLPYRVEDLVVDHAAAGVRLAGTLTMPPGPGRAPAVVLITGSGPQDRDESLMGHRPFLILADHLTRQGVAVLRVDDRGVGTSTGVFGSATSADFADDAEAVFAYLERRPDVDATRIGLLGHSEGGLIAAMVAARNPRVAFVVMLAGTGVRGADVLVAQAGALVEAGGGSAEDVRAIETHQRAVLDLVQSTLDEPALARRLREVSPSPIGDAELLAQVRQLRSPWFRLFLDYDPAQALERVRVPVLALNGSRDRQVLPSQNLPAIRRALDAGGNRRVDVEELPGLNHLFQTARTGAPSEYGEIEETMAPAVLERVSSWIVRQTSTAAR